VPLEATYRSPWQASTRRWWVGPDGTWSWKDEDELEEAVVAGWLTRGEAEAARAEGERVLAEWPFPTDWEGRRPDPAWGAPTLPKGWSSVDLSRQLEGRLWRDLDDLLRPLPHAR
jgi:hypothetical protein